MVCSADQLQLHSLLRQRRHPDNTLIRRTRPPTRSARRATSALPARTKSFWIHRKGGSRAHSASSSTTLPTRHSRAVAIIVCEHLVMDSIWYFRNLIAYWSNVSIVEVISQERMAHLPRHGSVEYCRAGCVRGRPVCSPDSVSTVATNLMLVERNNIQFAFNDPAFKSI